MNWGIVTAPVDPNNRNQSSYLDVSLIFSVNAASQFAKINGKSQGFNLSSWTAYNADQDGRKMDAFYKLEPKRNNSSEFDKAPAGFFFAY
ncbi:hypothetical protein SD71_10535 [Cohnella kolymensis]|uniref:Uncharacterized protein n=1 Tax=Cohnella kolymensis TaxID=1590652 RepID=A0ABR5A453_9BACL|nr:hypothetical protein [Cohnella kolymensis]KIL35831.1 hypothetical protein SD71_10535 [Cohnella kolymensis]